MPGPGKLPLSLKMISGTVRKDRLPPPGSIDLPTLEELPPPPDWLPNSHAVKEWNRLGPVLVANKLLTEGGLSAFGQLCALHGKLVQLWAAGESPNAAMLAQHRALTNDYGLTPVAQGKVKPVAAESKPNSFSGNGRRPAAAE